MICLLNRWIKEWNWLHENKGTSLKRHSDTQFDGRPSIISTIHHVKSTFPLGPLGAIFHKWHTDFIKLYKYTMIQLVVCWFMICNSGKHQCSKQVTLHDGSRFRQNPLKDILGFSVNGFLKMKAHENGDRVTCHSCTVPHKKNAKKSPIHQRRPMINGVLLLVFPHPNAQTLGLKNHRLLTPSLLTSNLLCWAWALSCKSNSSSY